MLRILYFKTGYGKESSKRFKNLLFWNLEINPRKLVWFEVVESRKRIWFKILTRIPSLWTFRKYREKFNCLFSWLTKKVRLGFLGTWILFCVFGKFVNPKSLFLVKNNKNGLNWNPQSTTWKVRSSKVASTWKCIIIWLISSCFLWMCFKASY